MTEIDVGLLVLRCAVGLVMLLHGLNHAFRGGRLPGTARWFESIGIRPGWLHARLATAVEIGAGVLLFLGLLTPLGAAGVAGTMLVALIANHLKNGFFIFRPGEGYEYVLTLCLVSIALGSLGGGRLSLDHLFGIRFAGWLGLLTVLVLGCGGGLVLLAACWRPRASLVARDAQSD